MLTPEMKAARELISRTNQHRENGIGKRKIKLVKEIRTARITRTKTAKNSKEKITGLKLTHQPIREKLRKETPITTER